MNSEKLNVVLVGVGHDHAHDAFKYVTSEDSRFNLLGIVLLEKDEDNYALYKQEYDEYEHFTIDEVLALKDLDAVIIETDDTLLSMYAQVFADKKINMHMDKPGSQIKEEFDRVANTCKSNGTVFHLGYMYRYNPSVKEALRLYRSGALGKIYYIEAQMNITHPDKKKTWLKNFEGGMMNFLGCHLVDVVTLFLGKPDSVTSFNISTEERFGNDISYAVLRYGNTFSTVNSTAVEIDGFARRHIVIAGEKGLVEIAPTELFIDGKLYSRSSYKTFGDNPDLDWAVKDFGPTHRYKEMFEEFVDICRGEKQNPYDYDHEIMVHDVLLAACKEYGKETKL